MLDFFTNRIAVTQLVGLLFAALAALHVIVPPTVNPTQTIAVILLASTAISAILRFSHPGDGVADAKSWWQSRTIWTQILAALFAGAALVGYVPSTDAPHALETVMTLVALVSMALGKSISQPIGGSSGVQCAPLAVAGAVAVALAVSLAGCTTGSLPLPKTPAQGIYSVLGQYEAAVHGAAAYAQQPTASPAAIRKIHDAKETPALRSALRYARAYVACRSMPVGTAIDSTGAAVDCSLFDFSSGTAAGYAATINSIVVVLLNAAGGVK